MAKIDDDGGPAFPRPSSDICPVSSQQGMSLRDYFATQADPGDIWVGAEIPSKVLEELMGRDPPNFMADPLANAQYWAEATAKWKYMMADAMIKERSRDANGD
jgi:hypothetical protein